MKYEVTNVETGYVVYEGTSAEDVQQWVHAHGGPTAHQARAVSDDHVSLWDEAAR